MADRDMTGQETAGRDVRWGLDGAGEEPGGALGPGGRLGGGLGGDLANLPPWPVRGQRPRPIRDPDALAAWRRVAEQRRRRQEPPGPDGTDPAAGAAGPVTPEPIEVASTEVPAAGRLDDGADRTSRPTATPVEARGYPGPRRPEHAAPTRGRAVPPDPDDDRPGPGRRHETLLALAGRIDDDALSSVRELVAVDDDAAAAEVLGGCLLAAAVGLTGAERTVLEGWFTAARVDPELVAALPSDPGAVRRSLHRFVASTTPLSDGEAGEDGEAVARAASRLPGVHRVHQCWRVTPAGSTPGPVPHRVVLVEADSPDDCEHIAHHVAHAARALGAVSVEVFARGVDLPAYHRDAVAAATPLPTGTATGPASPEDASPEDASPEDASPEDTSPEDTSPEDTSPEDTSPEDTSPEDFGSEDFGSEDARSGSLAGAPAAGEVPAESSAPPEASAPAGSSAPAEGAATTGRAPWPPRRSSPPMVPPFGVASASAASSLFSGATGEDGETWHTVAEAGEPVDTSDLEPVGTELPSVEPPPTDTGDTETIGADQQGTATVEDDPDVTAERIAALWRTPPGGDALGVPSSDTVGATFDVRPSDAVGATFGDRPSDAVGATVDARPFDAAVPGYAVDPTADTGDLPLVSAGDPTPANGHSLEDDGGRIRRARHSRRGEDGPGYEDPTDAAVRTGPTRTTPPPDQRDPGPSVVSRRNGHHLHELPDEHAVDGTPAEDRRLPDVPVDGPRFGTPPWDSSARDAPAAPDLTEAHTGPVTWPGTDPLPTGRPSGAVPVEAGPGDAPLGSALRPGWDSETEDAVNSQLSDRERELLARLHDELASRERLESGAPDPLTGAGPPRSAPGPVDADGDPTTVPHPAGPGPRPGQGPPGDHGPDPRGWPGPPPQPGDPDGTGGPAANDHVNGYGLPRREGPPPSGA